MTLTLDQVIWHTVVYHSLTSTYIPHFVQIGKLFVDGRMYGWALMEWTFRPALLDRR